MLVSIFLNFWNFESFDQPPLLRFSSISDPLLQKLDSRYYYPSQLGLKKLKAKVKWLQKDLTSSQLDFISHPEVLFSWNAESGERSFQIDPRLKGLTETRREEIKNFFLNYREVILPRSLSQTLSGFKLNRTEKTLHRPPSNINHSRSRMELKSIFWKSIQNIGEYPKSISKETLHRIEVVSHFKYIQREGNGWFPKPSPGLIWEEIPTQKKRVIPIKK